MTCIIFPRTKRLPAIDSRAHEISSSNQSASSTEHMTADIQIQNLLRSQAVQEINFRFRPLNISGHGYRDLSERFANHPIRHRIRVTARPELLSPQALGSYDPGTDKLLLRSSNVLATARGRSIVVHECTHALMDLRGRSSQIRSEEGAAFIAEAWYLLAINEDPTAPEFGLHPDISSIASAVRDRARGTRADMTRAEMATIRRVMRTEYAYGAGRYISDGICGRRFPGS